LFFGGALFGIFLRAGLPEHYLSAETKDVVKLGMALVSTMAALVLRLLIASAKSSYDAQNTALVESSARIVLLDRVLAHYGPEAKEVRDLLRNVVAGVLDRTWPKKPSESFRSGNASYRSGDTYRQNTSTLAEGRKSTLDKSPSIEYRVGCRTNALVAAHTAGRFDFHAVTRNTGILTYSNFC
jgi:hypothetical protein